MLNIPIAVTFVFRAQPEPDLALVDLDRANRVVGFSISALFFEGRWGAALRQAHHRHRGRFTVGGQRPGLGQGRGPRRVFSERVHRLCDPDDDLGCRCVHRSVHARASGVDAAAEQPRPRRATPGAVALDRPPPERACRDPRSGHRHPRDSPARAARRPPRRSRRRTGESWRGGSAAVRSVRGRDHSRSRGRRRRLDRSRPPG